MRKRVLAVVLAAVSFQSMAQTALAEKCSDLAAAPSENGGRGVPYAKIDAKSAVPACKAALAKSPGDAKLWFQYGRALEKAGKPDEAMKAYEEGAKRGSAGAINNMGEITLAGKGGIPRSFVEAELLFKKAEKMGSQEAGGNLDGMKKRREVSTGREIPKELRGQYSMPGMSCKDTRDATAAFGGFSGFEVSARTVGRMGDLSCSVLDVDSESTGVRLFLSCSENDPSAFHQTATLTKSDLRIRGVSLSKRCN